MGIHADAEGTAAVAEITTAPQPCLLCGVDCAVRFLGMPLHIPCWWGSTADWGLDSVADLELREPGEPEE